MKRLAIPLLAAALLFGVVGCGTSTTSGGVSGTTVKAILQSAATSLETALTLLNVNWATTKFDQDVNATIAAWQVGANWKAQVISLLGPVSADVSTIECGSNTKCQSLITIFQGAIQSIIADLGGTATKAGKRKLPRYDSYAQFKTAWDAEAPAGAQLPVVSGM